MALPIKLEELMKLTMKGIKPEDINHVNVRMESDKFICVREASGNLSIVEMSSASMAPERKPMKAESVIMNPVAKVLALSAKVGPKTTLQIFNMEMRTKMKAYEFPADLALWTWIDAKTIGIVTAESVFHWSMEGDSAPTKVFDRHETMRGCQILNYKASPDLKWLVLNGIKQEAGQIVGCMQLFSIDKKISQPMPGFAADFATISVASAPDPLSLFCFCNKAAAGGEVTIVKIGGSAQFDRKVVAVGAFDPTDFPVAMQASTKYDVLYLITKGGIVHIYDTETGTLIYQNRISDAANAVFCTTPNTKNGGIIAVNKMGQVLSVTIDEANLVPHIASTLRNPEMAMRLANKHDLPGADQMMGQQFEQLFTSGNYAGCGELCASCTRLRTAQTLSRLQSAASMQGGPPPVLAYLQAVLNKTKLNVVESCELARQVLQRGQPGLMQQWLDQDKLECSKELGDLIKPANAQLALKIYLLGKAHDQVIMGLVEGGQMDKIMTYVQKVEYNPDWTIVVQSCIRMNATAAQQLASTVLAAGVSMDVMAVFDAFIQCQLVEPATAFALDALKGESTEEKGPLQTRVLEVNLTMGQPQVADAILGQEIFQHYDKPRIAGLCEQQGLVERALSHYTELSDIKRTVVHTHRLRDPQFLVNWFGTLPPEWCVECLEEMLRANMRQNSAVVVNIATKYTEPIGVEHLIALFEKFKCIDGLFFYLGSVLNTITDPEVTFKYIEAATKCNQFKEVERVTRESTTYDAEKVKDFLKESKLADPRPLINVCDKHGFVDDLVKFFHANNQMKFIEQYALKVNPAMVPIVAGTLMDLDSNEDFVKNLILTAGNYCPAGPLVEEMEKRNHLKMLLPWLEARLNEGSTDVPVHNAIAKIYVDTNQNPEHFLRSNQFYDSAEVGKYCEKRDPNYCVIAFTRGQCDDEMIDVCQRYSLFKALAKYLVERANTDLWAKVLVETNEARRQLIDQVVSTALPECNDAEKVSLTVKAFMDAQLPNELIELLDKIVLGPGSQFANEKTLQNLLIFTAVKADKSRVMEYINRLDNFDAKEVAAIATDEGLFEESFALFRKVSDNEAAMGILLDHIKDLARGLEFAQRCDDSAVWSLLGTAQLRAAMVKEAVESYCKAQDPSHFQEVITAAQTYDCFDSLVTFLTMARKKQKDQVIDTELVYAYCKTNSLVELEEFIGGPNVANVQQLGDRCFDEQMYEPAKLLFTSISNYARLSTTLSKLSDFSAAVDAARKANSSRTWREVCQACVASEEFRLAQVCGLHIIVQPDELEDLIEHYEKLGHVEELQALLEAGLGLERAHMGIFTELGALYAKYNEERLFEHIKIFWARINIPKLVRVCEICEHWTEQCFLYIKCDAASFQNNANTYCAQSFSHLWLC
jgi:clathrin heavy chain